MLTRQEKERLVIDLFKQEKTIREIAKEVHMSFGYISTIIKKEFGSNEDDKSKEVKAFELFSKGLKPLNVIMKLNMKTDEVKNLHTEYLNLCELVRINEICKELGEDVEPFFRLYKIMKEQGLGPEETVKAVKYGNDLPILELKHESLKEEIKQIEDKKQILISESENLENVIALSRNVITNLDQGIEQRTRDVQTLDYRRKNLAGGILEFMSSKE